MYILEEIIQFNNNYIIIIKLIKNSVPIQWI